MPEPLIDVVMLVSHQPTWADLAIRAIEHHTKNPYRLILVDQATEGPMQKVLEAAKSRGHTVLRMAENRSFSNGNNAGIRIGSSKFVCILNDDAMVTEGWDLGMVQDCSQKEVGIVGARTNYAAGPTADPSWIGEPPYMAFVCVMFRREVWDKVGPLDEENFTGFSGEDLDYCWRVRKHGLKLRVCKGSYVLHAGSRSIVKEVSGGTKDAGLALQMYNDHNAKFVRVLEEKWGRDWVIEHSKLKQKVLVVSYHAEEWTRVRFAGDLVMLKAGTIGPTGGGSGDPELASRFGFTYFQHVRSPIHVARQAVCDYAFKKGFDYLVQLDDDATFPNDLIPRLLNHQKEVVCAMAFQRKPPYYVCAYEESEDGLTGTPLEETADRKFMNTGLRKVYASGFHVSALKLSVLKKFHEYRETDPKTGQEKFPTGIRQYFGGFENKLGEDFAFCANLKKIGVPVHVDTDLHVGHIASGFVVDTAYKQKFLAGQAP